MAALLSSTYWKYNRHMTRQLLGKTHPFIVDDGPFFAGGLVSAEVLMDAPITTPMAAHAHLASESKENKRVVQYIPIGQTRGFEIWRLDPRGLTGRISSKRPLLHSHRRRMRLKQ